MILLTGATGFLGSHLLVGLLANGHEVIASKDHIQILPESAIALNIKNFI